MAKKISKIPKIESLLSNNFLKRFIEIVGLRQEQKSYLLSELANMIREERINLFSMLKDIYLLDLREKEAIERVNKFLGK